MRLLLCLVLVLCPVVALAQAPATAPADADTQAVLDTFRRYNDAMMRQDAAAMITHNLVGSPREQSLAEAMVAGDIAVARLKTAAQEAFGGDAAERVGRAVGDVSNKDLETAVVRIDGDRARVTLGEAGGIQLQRKDGRWHFDMGAANATDDQVAQVVGNFRKRTERFEALAGRVKAGELKSLEETVAAATELR